MTDTSTAIKNSVINLIDTSFGPKLIESRPDLKNGLIATYEPAFQFELWEEVLDSFFDFFPNARFVLAEGRLSERYVSHLRGVIKRMNYINGEYVVKCPGCEKMMGYAHFPMANGWIRCTSCQNPKHKNKIRGTIVTVV